MSEAFIAAVNAGDAAAVGRLLEADRAAAAAIDAPLFAFGGTALGIAAGRGDLPLIDVLLACGADPNRKSDWWAGGFHPLHVAEPSAAERIIAAGGVPDACAAARLDDIDRLRAILDADPGRVHERGGDGQTPLHFARSRAVIDLLLDRGADPDARDVDHRSTAAEWMLERARGVGRYDLAAYLVARGAAADIFLAAALGDLPRIAQLLAADRDLLELRTGLGDYGERPPSSYHIYFWSIGWNRSPLAVAEQFDQAHAVDAMLSVATPRQRLLHACLRADADEAHRLLRRHPGLIDALHPGDHRLLPHAARTPDPAAVALMLELGFDPAATGADGGTVLHAAAWEGSVEALRAALRHPAAAALIESTDALHGATPLVWCCHGSMHCVDPGADHAAVARLLLEAGARPLRDATASPAVRAVLAERGG